MKNLRFKNVLLLSRTEQTARQEDLSCAKTAILGGNKRGKSCLIKSLYQAFGADPEITHPNWKSHTQWFVSKVISAFSTRAVRPFSRPLR